MHTINFQGGWRSTYLSQFVGFRDLSFASQTELAVSGYYVSSDDPTFSLRPFTGTLTRDNGLEIGLNDGTIHMSGYLIQSEYPFGARIVLTFLGGTADGKTLQFEPYSSY